jgi:cytochrome c
MRNKILLGVFLLTLFSAFSIDVPAQQPKALLTSVELGAINPKMVSEGKNLYTSKCFICHDLDQKKVGPTLRNVTKERKPEYIMNVILNPQKMQKSDPILIGLLKKFNNVPMPDSKLSETQARSLLEYLRSVAK